MIFSLSASSKKRVDNIFSQVSREINFARFDIVEFVDLVYRLHGVPIYVKGWEFPNSSYGCWFTSAHSDGRAFECVFYNTLLPRYLRIRTILHECSHILCGHKTKFLSLDDFAWAVQDKIRFESILSNEVVWRITEDDSVSQVIETEAEYLAHLIQVELFKYDSLFVSKGSSLNEGLSYLGELGCL